MTLAELIAYVDKIRPNAYDKDVMTGWVNEIEWQVYDQVLSRAMDFTGTYIPYKYDLDAERELFVDDAHKGVYVYYLLAQMDHSNMEIDRYNADTTMHQAAWQDYAANYRRNHIPKGYETPIPWCFWEVRPDPLNRE